ncbi:hypothetical protein MNBD_ALPHA04-1170 [hydrothermal vent metagenome]|uniref:Uncharacterized protein n=1 Tax=hydrothermal vent metagenome TaxID=652676 RepID=A0A3B0S011_9ZZZZ
MQLIEHLNALIDHSNSYVQVQLAKEDLQRIIKLEALVHECASLEDLIKAGLYLGWTSGDLRTHEIAEPLKNFIAAYRELEVHGPPGDREAKMMDAWRKFHAERMVKLIHCL